MLTSWTRPSAPGWPVRQPPGGSRRDGRDRGRRREPARRGATRWPPGALVRRDGHKEGVVVAQREVDHKTNEITEFRPLLEDLDLEGAVVTADAMHAQRDHASFLVEEKNADYVFTVKGNQPGTLAKIEGLFEGCFPPVSHPD